MGRGERSEGTGIGVVEIRGGTDDERGGRRSDGTRRRRRGGQIEFIEEFRSAQRRWDLDGVGAEERRSGTGETEESFARGLGGTGREGMSERSGFHRRGRILEIHRSARTRRRHSFPLESERHAEEHTGVSGVVPFVELGRLHSSESRRAWSDAESVDVAVRSLEAHLVEREQGGRGELSSSSSTSRERAGRFWRGVGADAVESWRSRRRDVDGGVVGGVGVGGARGEEGSGSGSLEGKE